MKSRIRLHWTENIFSLYFISKSAYSFSWIPLCSLQTAHTRFCCWLWFCSRGWGTPMAEDQQMPTSKASGTWWWFRYPLSTGCHDQMPWTVAYHDRKTLFHWTREVESYPHSTMDEGIDWNLIRMWFSVWRWRRFIRCSYRWRNWKEMTGYRSLLLKR